MRFILDLFHSIPSVIKYPIYILFILVFLVFIFLNFSPVFGAHPDKDSKSIIENSRNFVTGKFLNLKSDYKNISSLSESSDKNSTLMSWIAPPKDKNPTAPLPTIQFHGNTLTEGKFVWLGHSTLLMNTAGLIIMTDPVFNRASPAPIFGKPFTYENPINIDDLPKVDAVIISHDHYDHLDSKAITDLSKIVDRFFVPLGVKAHLERWGVDADRISELD